MEFKAIKFNAAVQLGSGTYNYLNNDKHTIDLPDNSDWIIITDKRTKEVGFCSKYNAPQAWPMGTAIENVVELKKKK